MNLGEAIRALTGQITPVPEHVLGWSHITTRMTVLEQYPHGVAHRDDASGQRLLACLKSIN